MELNGNLISMTKNEASSLRALAVKEFNRKIKRKMAKGVRPSEFAMELSNDRAAIVELGDVLDKAWGHPVPATKVD